MQRSFLREREYKMLKWYLSFGIVTIFIVIGILLVSNSDDHDARGNTGVEKSEVEISNQVIKDHIDKVLSKVPNDQ